MKKTYYFVTGSINKFREFEAIWNKHFTKDELKIFGLKQKKIDLEEIQELNPVKIIEAKLNQAHKLYPKGRIFIDDTSLYMHALKGKRGALPGPFIKWFIETIEKTGIVKIAKCFGNTKATAKCIIGFVDEHGEKHYFLGKTKGKIVDPRPSDIETFGWDSIFEPAGQKDIPKTFAQMTEIEKNEFSMRSDAVKELIDFLKKEKR